MKEKYTKPKTINLNETTDISDILEVVGNFDATAEQISDIFSMGINPDIKKRFDLADLIGISVDADRYREFLYKNPDKYISEKQEYTESMHLSEEESDEWRPHSSEPRLFPVTIIQAFIDDFIFKTEDIIGKTTCINDIKQIDGIYNSITLIKPRLKNSNGKNMNNHDNIDNYGFANVITEIRNGLMHNSYIIYGGNVYINSPKGGKNGGGFEAVVSCAFLDHMYHFGRRVSRKPKEIWLNEEDIKWKKGYEANKHNLKKIITETRKSNELMDLTDQRRYLYENGTAKTQNLSAGQKELLKHFFKEQPFCKESLMYAIIGMGESSTIGLDFWYQQTPGRENRYLLGIRNKYLKINPIPGRQFMKWQLWHRFTEGDDINNRLIWRDESSILEYIKKGFHRLDGSSLTEKELLHCKERVLELKSILEPYKCMVFESNFRLDYLKILYISKFFINNPILELAKPQKRNGTALKTQCINFIMNKCKNKPDIYRSRESKKDNLDKILGHNYWLRIFKQFTSGQLSTNQIIQKAFEDKRLTSNQREILKDNILSVIEKWEKQLDEVTIIQEPEHIRNAFAHHNYTIIPGCNKILLEDPSRNDFPDWRKVYDLDELYEDCLNKSKECFLGVK